MSEFAKLFFMLIVGHSLADYPLQGQFLAEGKNRHTAIGKVFWPYCLSSHALIHGGFVFVITGQLWMGLAETFIHAGTDWLKCEGKIGMFTDQLIHYVCKVIWTVIVIWWLP